MSATPEHPVSDTVSDQEATQPESASEAFFNSYVGITKAASITGRNKGTISKHTNGGKLPFITNEKGERQYKVADLYDLYRFQQPDTNKPKPPLPEQKQPDGNAIATAVELAILKEREAAKDEALQQLKEQLRESKDREAWLKKQYDLLTLRLTGPTAPPDAPPAAEPVKADSPPPLTFWQRWFPPKK